MYYPSFEKEAEPLLNEYGCLHFKFSILLGISRPTYSNEQLEQMKAEDKQTFEFEGKEYTRYEASQLQRKIETAVRHEKDLANMAKASGNDDLRREAQYKINLLTSKYAQLSKASGLPTKMERMQVGGFRRVKTKNELTKAANGGIIKIHQGRQDKHILGSNNYKNGRSYFIISNNEIKSIINDKAGTGKRVGNKEKITVDKIIGVNVNKKHSFKTLTDTANIHYSQDGAHLVPTHAQLKTKSVSELKEYCKKVAFEYYSTPEYTKHSGSLSISEKEKRIHLLLSQKLSKTSLIKDIKSMEKKILRSRGEIK